MKAPRTGAQRQAAYKARQQAAGLVQFTAWVHPAFIPALRQVVAKSQACAQKRMSENG